MQEDQVQALLCLSQARNLNLHFPGECPLLPVLGASKSIRARGYAMVAGTRPAMVEAAIHALLS